MDFADTFSAALIGVKTEDYTASMKKIIDNLDQCDKFAEQLTVNSWDQYAAALNVTSMTSSAYCYAANHNQESEAKKAIEIECRITRKMFAWVKTQLGSDSERLMIQYLLLRWHYQGDESWRIRAFKALLAAGRLWQKDGHYYLTGIHKKLGDNTFDMKGNRCYYESSTAQAFEVAHIDKKVIAEFVCEPVPELPKYFKVIWLCDGKGSARPISFSKKQKSDILKLISAS
jgi:hypothetical protein